MKENLFFQFDTNNYKLKFKLSLLFPYDNVLHSVLLLKVKRI